MPKKSKGLMYQHTEQVPTPVEYGRKPDYWLKCLDKNTNEKRKVGAAWNNLDKSISIRIDPFTILHSHPALVLTLFPITRGVNTSAEDD